MSKDRENQKYGLFMVKSSTGQILNASGTLLEGREPIGYCTEFNSLKGALLEKERLLKLYPLHICAIYYPDKEEPEYYFSEAN